MTYPTTTCSVSVETKRKFIVLTFAIHIRTNGSRHNNVIFVAYTWKSTMRWWSTCSVLGDVKLGDTVAVLQMANGGILNTPL